jgi:hypothetical protein
MAAGSRRSVMNSRSSAIWLWERLIPGRSLDNSSSDKLNPDRSAIVRNFASAVFSAMLAPNVLLEIKPLSSQMPICLSML